MQRREGMKGLVGPRKAKRLLYFCCVLRPVATGDREAARLLIRAAELGAPQGRGGGLGHHPSREGVRRMEPLGGYSLLPTSLGSFPVR